MLGIELDSLTLQARLPRDKFEHIIALLDNWSSKQHCTRKELESLIGNLQLACKVIPQGCTLLWRMRQDDHPIRLNQEFHLDLSWWCEFCHSWGILVFCYPPGGCHYLTFPFLQMWLDLWVIVQSLTANGSLGNGLLLNSLCLSHIKSYSQRSSQLHSEATDGPPIGLDFVQIIWLWLASQVQAP